MNEIPFKISEAKKEQGRHCCAYGCTNEPIQKKGGLCHKHFWRKRRKSDPVGVRFTQFKQKAKQRGIDFNLTLQEFRDFCQETGYCVKKGLRGFAATIDRINNNQGYHKGNIHLMSLRANVKKFHQTDKNHPDYTPF